MDRQLVDTEKYNRRRVRECLLPGTDGSFQTRIATSLRQALYPRLGYHHLG
jgi:hypothetical protein